MAVSRPVARPTPTGTVHRTIALLEGALNQLGVHTDRLTAERIGVMVNRAMSAQHRSFHTPEHIFDLADPDDPHVTLAALFHDVVYYHVDMGFSAEIGEVLEPYIQVHGDALRISENIASDDRAFFGCAAVFGFSPGDTLSPFGGLNEFLSALLMDILLEGTVSDLDLLIATACIEATIPFRPISSDGREPPELLAQRLRQTNEQFQLGLNDEGLSRVVTSAVRFANSDVQNFAEGDVARFLDNTWKLLPETNPMLRFKGVYTIRNYSLALLKMYGFLGVLQPESVFHQYNGFPHTKEYENIVGLARRNLTVGHRYLGIKLLTAGILHALAELTGGDAPVALFMGDLNPQEEGGQLSAHLPAQPVHCHRVDNEHDDLFRLLAHGRAGEAGFDLQHSPLSLFVYRCLSDEELSAGIEQARRMFSGDTSPEQFLHSLPRKTVSAIAEAASHMAFTRSEQLTELAGQFDS
ncbi:MAG: hypothetical protein ACOCYB_09095 [Alkalispirochaeta sp.]